MATALFVLGQPGSGKSHFTTKFIKGRLKRKEPWCLVDKDTTGACLSAALMTAFGLNPNDKDSPEYKAKVRDLEYQTALNIAAEQLKLGVNVVLPGPWTKEVNNGTLFNKDALGFPYDAKLVHIYIDIPSHQIKNRIMQRNKSRDEWKINNWEAFQETLKIPQGIVDNKVLTLDGTKDFKFHTETISNLL